MKKDFVDNLLLISLLLIYVKSSDINGNSDHSQRSLQNIRKLQESIKPEEIRMMELELETQQLKSKIDEGLQKWKTKKEESDNMHNTKVDLPILSHESKQSLSIEDCVNPLVGDVQRQKRTDESSLSFSSDTVEGLPNTMNRLSSIKKSEMCR